MNKRDFYEVLEIDKNSNEQEIKRAYKKLAKKYHPDIYKGEDGDAKFKEIAEAYEILSDQQKRAAYDQYGHAGVDPQQGGFNQGGGFGGFNSQDFDFGDIFGDMFGGGFGRGSQSSNPNAPRQGSDIEQTLNISFEESFHGIKKSVTFQVIDKCDTCDGSGAKDKNSVKTCTKCSGAGSYRVQQQSLFGMSIREVTCEQCNGNGKEITDKCNDCKGNGYKSRRTTLEINIPKGIENGQHIRIPGKGNAGENGGPNGDLYVQIFVSELKNFVREGLDVYTTSPITFTQAALGATVEVNTIDGTIELNIPEGTQTGTKFRLKNKGFTLNHNIGNLYIEVEVVTPHNLTKEQKELLSSLEDGTSHKNYKKSS